MTEEAAATSPRREYRESESRSGKAARVADGTCCLLLAVGIASGEAPGMPGTASPPGDRPSVDVTDLASHRPAHPCSLA